MKILKFDHTTLRFRKGINTTFRRFGSGLVPGPCRICKTCEYDGSKWIYDGEITNIQIFEFDTIPQDLEKIHHSGLSILGIYQRMTKHYQDFRASEIVQVISFVPFIDSQRFDDLPF